MSREYNIVTEEDRLIFSLQIKGSKQVDVYFCQSSGLWIVKDNTKIKISPRRFFHDRDRPKNATMSVLLSVLTHIDNQFLDEF